jgi:hypothetical protein
MTFAADEANSAIALRHYNGYVARTLLLIAPIAIVFGPGESLGSVAAKCLRPSVRRAEALALRFGSGARVFKYVYVAQREFHPELASLCVRWL